MTEKIITPIPITKENFAKYGDMISTKDIKPLEINNGYAKRYDGIANLNTSSDNGETTISIFSALKRNFPMKIDMMEKHPLGSQAFIPMKETTFLVFVAPKEKRLDLNKIEAFIIPPGIGVNYNPGTWHFPLISTEDMNFLVVDRKGSGNNLVIENFNTANIITCFIAIVGSFNIPVIKYSVEWWYTLHQPASFSLTEKPAMPALL